MFSISPRPWNRLKSRLRSPPIQPSTTPSPKDYFGGQIPVDPFARDDPPPPPPPPPPTSHVPDQDDKPLPQTPVTPSLPLPSSLVLVIVDDSPPRKQKTNNNKSRKKRVSELSISNASTSSSSDRTFYTCLDAEDEPVQLRVLDYDIIESDEEGLGEDRDPQPPGAFRSSTDLFREAVEREINPLSLSAARNARRIRRTHCSLRRATSSPMLPPSKLSPRRGHKIHASESSQLPRYTPCRIPSYKSARQRL